MTLADEVAEALNDLRALSCDPWCSLGFGAGHSEACQKRDAAILRYGDLCRKAGREEAPLPESIQQALNSGDGTYKP